MQLRPTPPTSRNPLGLTARQNARGYGGHAAAELREVGRSRDIVILNAYSLKAEEEARGCMQPDSHLLVRSELLARRKPLPNTAVSEMSTSLLRRFVTLCDKRGF